MEWFKLVISGYLVAMMELVLASGGPRLTVTGTTVGPGYARPAPPPEGRGRSASCPDSHPYPVADYESCCSDGVRAASGCGGGGGAGAGGTPLLLLLERDPASCCRGESVGCPGGGQCRSAPGAYGVPGCPDGWDAAGKDCYKYTDLSTNLDWAGANQAG